MTIDVTSLTVTAINSFLLKVCFRYDVTGISVVHIVSRQYYVYQPAVIYMIKDLCILPTYIIDRHYLYFYDIKMNKV